MNQRFFRSANLLLVANMLSVRDFDWFYWRFEATFIYGIFNRQNRTIILSHEAIEA